LSNRLFTPAWAGLLVMIGLWGSQAKHDSLSFRPEPPAMDQATAVVATGSPDTLSGKVYHDIDKDQLHDTGEAGQTGVVVKLYEDVNQDGNYDGGDVYLASDTTDSDGLFSFTVIPGTAGTVQSRISATMDDVEEEGPDGTTHGNIYTNSGDVELVYDPESPNSGTQVIGLRFNNITVPPGAIITDAFINFTADTPDVGNPSNSSSTTVTIWGEDIDHAPIFTTTGFNVTTRTTTSASIDWSPSAWTTNNVYPTPDLTSIVSEIVDRPAWSSGNSMAFIIAGSNAGGRVAHSYDGVPASAPELVISYTVPSFPAHYLITLDTTTLPTGAYMSTDTLETAVFSALGQSEAGNDFGFVLVENCYDGIDNDGDGLVDCADPDCAANDNDSDGICDANDLDNDNDGIPDTDEMDFVASENLNTPAYATDTDLTTGTTTVLTGLYEGDMTFRAELYGTASWDNGVQIENLQAYGGGYPNQDFIYLQPNNTNYGGNPANYVKYTLEFARPALIDLAGGGLNNDDFMEFTAFQGGTAVTVDASMFYNVDTGNGVLVSSNRVTGTGTNGGTDPLVNYFSLAIPQLLDSVVIISGKADNSTIQVTTSIYLNSVRYEEDSDGDGIPNYLDLDSENDGIPDIIEAGGIDHNGDGRVDYPVPGDPTSMTDLDEDGWFDTYDYAGGTVTSGSTLALRDLDSDGVVDGTDVDADNDGTPDLLEVGGLDATGDGRVDLPADVDEDGLVDAYDSDADDGPGGTGTDGEALVMTSGTDTGSDGLAFNDPGIRYISGSEKPLPDFDGDGVLNSFDLDSDNDGITDVIEAGALDLDRDGVVDGSDDDADGLIDAYDVNASDGPGGTGTDGTALVYSTVDGSDNDDRLEILSDGIVDGDDDDVIDALDVDSDNDGIYDIYESQPTASLSTVDGSDSDGDGIDDAFDDKVGFGGNGAVGIDPVDTDGDGTPDYRDKDSDNDAVPDWQEAWDAVLDGDSRPDSTNWTDLKLDSDGDGLVDGYDSDDGDMSVWTILFHPPDDDGTSGSTTSVGVDALSTNSVNDIFPNNGLGDDPAEPDWRDAGNASCSSAKMVYAITDTVSYYQYDELSKQHETGLSTGVIRATVLCHRIAGWYRFYNPLEPKRYLFAIQNGTNTVDLTEAIDYVEIEIEAEPVANLGSDSGLVVMARSWYVALKDSLNGTVNVRFYFTDAEYQAFDSTLNDLSNRYLSGTTQTEWFKVANGLDYGNVPSSIHGFSSVEYTDLDLYLSGTKEGQADTDAKGNNKNYVQFNGLTSFSGGTLGGTISGTLPVEWLDFSVKQQGEDAVLSWVTATESQTDYFAIERSVDGFFFSEVGREKAAGNSQESRHYGYQDQGVIYQLGHRLYYRLRQVDQDGSFSYSEVVELELEDRPWDVWFNAMPVPVHQTLTVRYDLFWQQAAQLELLNLLGSRMQLVPLTEKAGQVEMDVSRLPSGIYYLRLQGEDRQVLRKIEVRH
jgi:hypothetical protein